MSINFAAANMAGYNNPQIEIIPFENGVQVPTFADIVTVLSRGVVPFLRYKIDSDYLLLSPSLISSGGIVFSGVYVSGEAEAAPITILVCSFVSGLDAPILHQQILESPHI